MQLRLGSWQPANCWHGFRLPSTSVSWMINIVKHATSSQTRPCTYLCRTSWNEEVVGNESNCNAVIVKTRKEQDSNGMDVLKLFLYSKQERVLYNLSVLNSRTTNMRPCLAQTRFTVARFTEYDCMLHGAKSRCRKVLLNMELATIPTSCAAAPNQHKTDSALLTKNSTIRAKTGVH